MDTVHKNISVYKKEIKLGNASIFPILGCLSFSAKGYFFQNVKMVIVVISSEGTSSHGFLWYLIFSWPIPILNPDQMPHLSHSFKGLKMIILAFVILPDT